MPKFPSSAHHASHRDGKKIRKTKHRGHHYRDAAKARKLRQTRIKGVVEEVVEPVEPGKARPLRRAPKYELAKINRMLRANCEESQPVSTPTAPAEVYGPNSVNFNVPRVIVATSEATAKRKQAAAGDDDGDTTDVEDSEDVVVVPAGFVEAAETLGLLSAPAVSSGPREEPPSAPHAHPDEKSPSAERLSTEIETPSSSPAVPQIISSVPSPSLSPSLSSQPSHVVPESALVEVVYNDSQNTAASSSPIHLEPSAPISVPQDASVPESFQEATWSSASQHQNSTFWDNNMNDAQTFHFHQQDIQNAFYFGYSTSDDVNMEFSGATTMEPPVYSVPTMWKSPQLEPEHQMFYSHVGQVASNNNQYQTYTMRPNWASMQSWPVQNEFVQQSAQTNQPPFNHAVDPLTAASCFWTALSGNSRTSQTPTTVPEIIKSTPTQGDEQRPQEKPTKVSLSYEPIWQDRYQRRYRLDDDGGLHPFPNLRGCKNMRLINMSGELEESRVIRSMPGNRRLKPPVGSKMDLINRLRMEAESHAAPRISKVDYGKRRREDSQPDSARTNNPDFGAPPRQRRRCKPDASKLKTPVPAEKRSRKLHRQHEASLEGPTSSRTPPRWDFSRFCPSISSLADRLFKFF